MMVKAHACASSKEYDNAVQILKGLDAMVSTNLYRL